MKFLDCYKILLALSLGCTTLLFLPSLQNFEVDPDPEESQLDILRRERPILSYVKSLSHLRYKDRIDSVREQCSLNRYTPEVQEVNNDTKWNTDLWFDYDNQLLFCQISKISSSTWVKHLMRLKGLNSVGVVHQMMKKKIPPNKHRPLMREEHFPLKNETFTQAKESLLSFVFVREPFARIVSAYNDKMVRDWSKPVFDLRWMRDEIMEKYRKNAGPKAAPTPEEFVRYIVDKSKEVGPYYLDNHIKPIWASCPFCSVDFDVIGKLEEFDKDSLFIHANMNLIDKVDITEHHHKTPVKVAPNTKGSSIQSFSKADDFYAKVPKHLIQELYQFCKLDYDMFGYPPPTKYME